MNATLETTKGFQQVGLPSEHSESYRQVWAAKPVWQVL